MGRFARAQRGNTMVGFIVGLVLGLFIAVVVALVITKAPIPFINKVAKNADPGTGDAKMPDPNKSLYAKDVPQPAEINAAPAPAPAMPVMANVAPPKAGVSAPDSKAPVVDHSRVDPPDVKTSMLQEGAFKSSDEAENLKAKLALIGLEAHVSNADKDGVTIYRVRTGPYARVEELNRARQTLVENGIDGSVVPPAQRN